MTGAVAGRPPRGVGNAVEHVAGVVGDLVTVDVLVGRRRPRRLGRGLPGDVHAIRAAGLGRLGRLGVAVVVGGRVGAVVTDQEPPAGRDQHQHERGREDPQHRAAALLVVDVVVRFVRLGLRLGRVLRGGDLRLRGRLGGGRGERAVRRVPLDLVREQRVAGRRGWRHRGRRGSRVGRGLGQRSARRCRCASRRRTEAGRPGCRRGCRRAWLSRRARRSSCRTGRRRAGGRMTCSCSSPHLRTGS